MQLCSPHISPRELQTKLREGSLIAMSSPKIFASMLYKEKRSYSYGLQQLIETIKY